MERNELDSGIFTIDGVLSKAECNDLIARAEAHGLEIADRSLAGDLWERVREAIPAILSGRLARGLNEKLRFHRYAAGQHLDWEPDEGGLLAFVVFLNDDYEGGAMRFASLEVHGRTGMALVFEHTHRPEVGEVSGGTRYVLRASVMYAPA